MQNRMKADHAGLTAAGFSPARHSLIVKLTRRLLWPFVRPFLFFLLEKITANSERLDANSVELEAIDRQLKRIAKENEAANPLIDKRLHTVEQRTQETAKFVRQIIFMQSEVNAVVNRFGMLELEVENIRNELARLKSEPGRPIRSVGDAGNTESVISQQDSEHV